MCIRDSLYTNHYNWLILILMMLAGALIRQFFVQRHGWHHGRASNPWPHAAIGVVLILAVIVGLKAMEPPPAAPGPKVAQAAGAPAPDSYAAIRPVLEQRCYSCHGEAVQMKNVRLDSPAALKTHAQAVYQQVAVLKQMPMSNATGITEAERAQIGEWFKAGAKTE